MRRLTFISNIRLTLKRLTVSAAIAAVILIAEYFIGNWLGFVFDDSSTLSILTAILPQRSDNKAGEVEYLNVGYDKELVTVKLNNSNKARGWDSIGSAVVTDRKILLKILEIAEKSDYRFLFLDVRFEKDLESPLDSTLFAKIKSMRDIVVSTHRIDDGYQISDSSLLKKAAYADYLTTYFSGFTKYNYLQRDSASVALKIYRDLDGGNIKRVGPFFFSDGKLCNNMQFLTFTSDDVIDATDARSRYSAFGGEILSLFDEETLSEMWKGKIIVVGDMMDDVHYTYAGRVAGPVLSVRAYRMLAEGKHIVDWRLVLLLFVVYGACAYAILFIHSLKIPVKLRERLFRHPLIVFLLLNVGWALLMYVLKVVVFLIFGASIILVIPSFIFSLLSMPDSYSEFKKHHNIQTKSNLPENITESYE